MIIFLLGIFFGLLQASTNILFVGDSHTVHVYGTRIDERLRSLPDVKVATYGVCGTMAAQLLKGATTKCGYFHRDYQKKEVRVDNGKDASLVKFETLLTNHSPNLVMISLGNNSAGYADYGYQQNKDLMEKVLLQGSQCIWIGPPKTRKRTNQETLGIYQGLVQAISELKIKLGKTCALIDSRPHEPHDQVLEPDQSLEVGGYGIGPRYPDDERGDGSHFDFRPEGKELYRFWADGVFMKLLEIRKITLPDLKLAPCPYLHP